MANLLQPSGPIPAQKILQVYGPGLSAGAMWEHRDRWLCIEAGPQISWMLGQTADQASAEMTRRGLTKIWIDCITTATPPASNPVTSDIPATLSKPGSKLQSWQRDVWRPSKAWKKKHPRGKGRGKHWISLAEYEKKKYGRLSISERSLSGKGKVHAEVG